KRRGGDAVQVKADLSTAWCGAEVVPTEDDLGAAGGRAGVRIHGAARKGLVGEEVGGRRSAEDAGDAVGSVVEHRDVDLARTARTVDGAAGGGRASAGADVIGPEGRLHVGREAGTG